MMSKTCCHMIRGSKSERERESDREIERVRERDQVKILLFRHKTTALA